ncbi:hypothetical protein HZC08_01015 [Candidatus Micrarchaeota archaeon]|nr:hypothetical protein [Candidatus Micrarchaeota archaeon]
MKELVLLGLISLLVFGCLGAQNLDKTADVQKQDEPGFSKPLEKDSAIPEFDEELYAVEDIDYSGLDIDDSGLSAPE